MSRLLHLLKVILLIKLSLAALSSALVAEELEEGAEIDAVGLFHSRASGGQINLRIVDNNFRLYFVNNEKKITKVEFLEAIIYYTSEIRKSEKESVLKLKPSADQLYLTSSRFIKPPASYRVRVLVRNPADPKEGAEDARENYSYSRLNQLKKAAEK